MFRAFAFFLKLFETSVPFHCNCMGVGDKYNFSKCSVFKSVPQKKETQTGLEMTEGWVNDEIWGNLFSSSHPSALTLLYCIILFLLLVSRIRLILTAALMSDRPSRLYFSIFLSFLSRWIQPWGCVVARTGGQAVCVSECVTQMTGKCVCRVCATHSHVWVCVISVVGPEVLTVPFHHQECSVIPCLCQRPPSHAVTTGGRRRGRRERGSMRNSFLQFFLLFQAWVVRQASSVWTVWIFEGPWCQTHIDLFIIILRKGEREKMEKGGPLWVICLFYCLRLHGGVYKYRGPLVKSTWTRSP